MIEKISFEKMHSIVVSKTLDLAHKNPLLLTDIMEPVLSTVVKEVNNKIDEINEKFDLIDNCLQELKNRADVIEEGINHLQRRT